MAKSPFEKAVRRARQGLVRKDLAHWLSENPGKAIQDKSVVLAVRLGENMETRVRTISGDLNWPLSAAIGWLHGEDADDQMAV